MTGMFSGAESFTGSLKLGSWDVSSVKHMENMFSHAPGQKKYSFNDPSITNWDVSNVWSMKAMFSGNAIFNSNLNDWNTRSVTNMKLMFAGTSAFNGDISTWDTSNVVDMSNMFHNANKFASETTQERLLNWDTSKVTSMVSMFQNATNFNSQSVAYWDVSNVVDMNNMFQNANKFNVDVSLWDINKVTDISKMFQDAWYFRQDLCVWGHMLRRRKDAMMSSSNYQMEEQEDSDVYLHSIFIDTSCENKLDPKIDETLSRGFCAEQCETEDKYVYPSPSTRTTLAPTTHKVTRMEKKKAFKAAEELAKTTNADGDKLVSGKDDNNKVNHSFLRFLRRLVYISAGVSVLVLVVRRFAPAPRGSRGRIISEFPRPQEDEFRDEYGHVGNQLPKGLAWNAMNT